MSALPGSPACTSAMSISWLKFHTSKGRSAIFLTRCMHGVSLW